MNIRLYKFSLLASSVLLLVISLLLLPKGKNMSFVALGVSVIFMLLYISLHQFSKGNK